MSPEPSGEASQAPPSDAGEAYYHCLNTEATIGAVDRIDLRDGRVAGQSAWYDLIVARRAVST